MLGVRAMVKVRRRCALRKLYLRYSIVHVRRYICGIEVNALPARPISMCKNFAQR